ncbi:efflux RND transporter periplasmic adaptor subunit [Roseovarius salinarum]|uniref:efflux RND transporter periplasmic adaptor subunit n=1 Tax=Roseovarius salinarum TaxID=1981892 RepID=UPI0012FFF6FE|nr:efflux RND transporter periplasmic adaptor subunit [Roseovarius salinarum]
MSRRQDANGHAEPAEPLRFEDDPGASHSAWIALALVGLVVGWFASGMLMQDDAPGTPAKARESAPVQVGVAPSAAETVADVLVVEGQAMPDRNTAVLAEAPGKLVEVPVRKGATLRTGDIIARLDATEREAAVRRAEAEVDRASRAFRNAKTLLDRGVGTVDRVASTRAALAAAEAQLAAAKEALDDTTIRAPFGGRLEDLSINAGEYVTAGASVARIVDNAPLTVRARVAQQSVEQVGAGQTAHVAFITGEERTGTVTFVGANADPGTRTFPMEVEVANDGGKIPSGVSAEIRIETGKTKAHRVSPALLALDERGALGLKTVDDDNRVAFYEVDVIKAGTDGVWVTGLPGSVRIITVGQGFVRRGERVAPRPDARAGPANGAGSP